ncbi:MAG: hypothetical protein ACLRXQ_12345 [Phascolarctobacterium faecium]
MVKARHSREDAVKIGFTVFTASIPVSMIFLTGDASINHWRLPAVTEPVGLLKWFEVMGLPMIVTSIITMVDTVGVQANQRGQCQ